MLYRLILGILIIVVGEIDSFAHSQDSYFSSLVDMSISKGQEKQEQYQAIIDNARRAYASNSTQLEKVKNPTDQAISFVQQNPSIKKEMGTNKISEDSSKILIFTSFSMPQELLWSYMKQAKAHNGKLIIRGLVENSFKKTVQAMDLGDNKILELEVNPQLFKEYQVTRVPTIVVLDKVPSQAAKFVGSVSINYVLDEINGSSDVAEE